ncbi:hypothetical protein DdX_15733 [Ditylenchus destructor]|uniref:Uncharacterized protein n=1 Tax=Ditylenchus destructor TaxID=166010 RepID=A0AAD4MQC2_9BILA|nr:hypothetical protein DdX_15733 [Ditylenchus destructor]
MDNGTMVETFKFLNYYQLAKKSLVSKRYRDLIQTHRHKLALLFSCIDGEPVLIKVFDKLRLHEEFNEWLIRNGYSKQTPIEGQVAEYDRRVYELRANVDYNGSTNILHACAELNHKHWPLFQHFVRLLMDPFIYVRRIELTQNGVLNLLAGAFNQKLKFNLEGDGQKFINWSKNRARCGEILTEDGITSNHDQELLELLLTGAFNQDSNRLQCKKLEFNLEDNVQKFIGWVKDHVLCDTITIGMRSRITNEKVVANYKEELLDFLMTGAQCTSAFIIYYDIPTRMVVEFIEKFMRLKSSDKCQVVEYIRNNCTHSIGKVLKRDFAGFIVKEAAQGFGSTERVFDILNIGTMDNGTMVEAFKFLNYYQLAKNSLVSKRFWNLILTHRHSLELLYVDSISMSKFHTSSSFITLFDKELLPEAYNEWVIRNGYSKQIPIEDQVGEQNALNDRTVYQLNADYNGSTNVLHAVTKLNHKHWPLFQHFVRLLLDPFVHISFLEVTPQNDVLNLLAGAFDPARSRLQCKTLKLNLNGNVQKFIGWIKGHVLCDTIIIDNCSRSNYEEELLDLMMTGAHCTSEISIDYCISSYVVVDFAKKFMDLKSTDEYQVVESVRDDVMRRSENVLKRDYAEFIVKEEMDQDDGSTERVFEFVNSDVRKKLQITENIVGIGDKTYNSFVIMVKNL